MVFLMVLGGLINFSFLPIKPIPQKSVNWITLDEAVNKYKDEPRPILIDLYTSWCYWCKVMDRKTYADRRVAEYINNHYYAVKVNAETKDTIMWNGKRFLYDAADKLNGFAVYITHGQPAFPTTVIFTSVNELPVPIPGMMKVGDMEPVLTYFREGAYKYTNFNSYVSGYKRGWR